MNVSNAVPKLTVPSTAGNYVVSLVGDSIWTIGRGKGNTIVLKSKAVSREHALIQTVEFQGLYMVYFSDLNSLNGSLINHQRVTSQCLLQDGDQITIGEFTLKFHDVVGAEAVA